MKRALFAMVCLALFTIVCLGAAGQDDLVRERDASRFARQGQFAVHATLPSYSRGIGVFDQDGDRVEYDDMATVVFGDTNIANGDGIVFNALVLSVRAGYGIINGLEVGVEAPFVQNELVGEVDFIIGPSQQIDQKGSGLGDMTVYTGFELPMGSLAVGALGFYKHPTGKHEDLDTDELSVGSGQADLGASGFIRTLIGQGQLDATVGHIIRFQGTSDDLDFDPGDITHVEIGGYYWLNSNVAVGAAFLFYTSGTDKVENSVTGSLETISNSGDELVSIAPGLLVHVNENLDFSVSSRMRRIGTSVSQVDTGFALFGKNDGFSSIPPVTVTANLRFP